MSLPAPAPSRQWFVGIEGEPTGPIGVSDLEVKIRDGVVEGDSLVWREGLDEWRPLSEVGELAAVFAACTAARPSPTPMIPTARPSVVAAEVAALNAVHGRSSNKKWVPWLVLLVGALFGGAVTFALLPDPVAPAPVVRAARPEPPPPAPPPPPAEEPLNENEEAAEFGEAEPVAADVAKRSVTPRKSSKAQNGAPNLPKLPELPTLPTGPKGPSSGSGANAGGGRLSASQLERTVSTYKSSVKRRCWERALSTRDANAPTSARVEVQITISPSGSVRKVTAGEDPRGYAGLSSCIERRVLAWQFPPPGASQTVKVPFVFAQQ